MSEFLIYLTYVYVALGIIKLVLMSVHLPLVIRLISRHEFGVNFSMIAALAVLFNFLFVSAVMVIPSLLKEGWRYFVLYDADEVEAEVIQSF